VQQLAEGSARAGLAARSAEISAGYRDRRTSASAVGSAADVLAYALSRLPATYAASEAALARLADRAPDFAPRTLLDLGCGPGTASWAACDMFPTIERATLVDSSPHFLTSARSLAADHPTLFTATFVDGNLAAPPAGSHDLVLVSYALTELPDPAAVVDRIWQSCSGALVIVEPGTPRDYERLMQVRQRLLSLGATIAAPCPHHAPCPLVAPDWCHFSVRLARSRDHMRLKNATLGYEDEKYSYLAVTRPTLTLRPPAARVLARPVETKFDLTLKLCEADGLARERKIPRRNAAAYRAVRKADWGDTI
jgi:ribosomal protein RSM22 (predicted rRNA methylase)